MNLLCLLLMACAVENDTGVVPAFDPSGTFYLTPQSEGVYGSTYLDGTEVSGDGEIDTDPLLPLSITFDPESMTVEFEGIKIPLDSHFQGTSEGEETSVGTLAEMVGEAYDLEGEDCSLTTSVRYDIAFDSSGSEFDLTLRSALTFDDSASCRHALSTLQAAIESSGSLPSNLFTWVYYGALSISELDQVESIWVESTITGTQNPMERTRARKESMSLTRKSRSDLRSMPIESADQRAWVTR